MSLYVLAFLIGVIAGLRSLTAPAVLSWAASQGPDEFAARLVTGGLCGAAFGTASPSLIGEVLAGVGGSVVGTLGGHELRVRLVKALGGNDLPIALVEDVIAIGGALLIAHATSVS